MFEGYVGKRVKKSDWEPGDIPYVTASVTNNGIDGYIGNPIIVKENLLTVNFFGDVYYQEGKVSFKDGTYGLKLRNKREECRNVYLWLATSIQKQTLQMGSYDNGLRLDDIKNIIIELPILTSEDTTPYWDYMAYYIHNIQQQYADQLEAKSEYELDLMCQILGVTRDDIVQRLEFTQPQYTNKFTIDEIFDIKSTKKAIHKNTIADFNGKYPYVTRKEGNNGIDSYINEDTQYLNPGNTISLAMDTYVLNYQEEPYFTGNKVKIVSYKGINKENALYIITALNKTLGEMTWGETMNMDKLNKIELELPVLAPNSKQIDWGAIRHVAVGGGVNYLATRQEICNRDLAIIRQLIQ